MSDQEKYEPNYHYMPQEVEDAMNLEEASGQTEEDYTPSYNSTKSSGPRRAKKKEKGSSILPVILVGILLSALVGGGARLAQSGFFWRPAPGSSDEADPGFGYDFDGDVEVNEGASEEYSLPPYEGDSSGLTIQLNQPGATESSVELSPAEFYKQQLPSTVSITVYAGQSAAYGSGMIISEDGYILTCAHVIDDTETCMVTLADDKQYEAKLVGSDEQTDLAVLKIEAKNLEPVTFCDSDLLEIGETVYVIGDPLGPEFRSSLSNGILSGLDRTVSSGGYAQVLMQVTAPVNSGNSGGPLFNRFGQVIGVVNMKMSSSSLTAASIDNMGLSIPSQTVKKIVESLAQNGSVTRPVLGISCYTLDEVHAHMSGMPEGLWIVSINENSDCARQGLLLGDLITEADGVPLTSVPQFQKIISDRKPGDTVVLTVWRDEKLAEEARKTQEEQEQEEAEGSEAETDPEGSGSISEEEEISYNFEYLGEFTVKLISSDELK